METPKLNSNKSFNQEKLVAVGILILFAIFSIYAFKHATINIDAGYYLTVARNLSQGNWPYSGVLVGYTYNYFFLQAIPFWLINTPAYWHFVFLQWIICIIGSMFIFGSLKKIGLPVYANLFVLGFYLLYQAGFGLFEIGLEPLVTLFFAATYFFGMGNRQGKLTLWHGLAAGICAVEAFFTKQYGIAGIVALGLTGLVYWWFHQKQVTGFLGIVLGIFTGIAINLAIVVFIFNVPLPIFLTQIRGGGYGSHSLLLWINESINWLVKSGAIFFILMLFSSFITILKLQKKSDLSTFILLSMLPISMVAMLTLQFYFQGYDHYYQLFAVPLVIIIAFSIKLLNHHDLFNRAAKSALFIYAAIFSFYFYRSASAWSVPSKELLVKQIKDQVGSRKTFLFSNTDLYFSANLNPVNLKRFGLIFPNAAPVDTIAAIINEAEVVIVDTANIQAVTTAFKELNTMTPIPQGPLLIFFKDKDQNQLAPAPIK